MPEDEKGFWMSVRTILKQAFGTDAETSMDPVQRADDKVSRLIETIETPIVLPAATINEAVEQLIRDMR